MTIRRLLVANRGEIARRVFRTCRTLGIETVAVYSDADADLPFVRGGRRRGPAAREHARPRPTCAATSSSGAALDAGADAVHPGYGFLSENADFARRGARRRADLGRPAAGGDRRDGLQGRGQEADGGGRRPGAAASVDPASATAADLPLLVKASAGGGGRGMRVVRAPADAREAGRARRARGRRRVRRRRRSSSSAYVEHGRHVEVQIFGDAHGHVLALGERDCSIQRRHQKIVEETPSPGLLAGSRRRRCTTPRAGPPRRSATSARARWSSCSPGGPLLLPGDEHPAPGGAPGHRAGHGPDLVALQVAVAEGRPLEAPADAPRGHAIEVRLYAEDPAAGWQPQSGRLTASTSPRSRRGSRTRRRTASGSTPASRPARRSAPTTTRCSRR